MIKERIEKSPIAFGIVSTIIIDVLFTLAHLLIPSGLDDSSWYLIDNILRVVFALPCVILLGYIIQGSGFKFVFALKGFARGVFACSAIFLLMLTVLLQFFNMTELNIGFTAMVPMVVLQQITTGLFEEALFRGLLMTAMLMKWGDTIRGRIATVLISGVLFGAVHLTNAFFGGDLASWVPNALGAGLMGMGYAAVYVYSKNLLCCMFIHAAYDIAVHMSNGLIAKITGGTLYNILRISQPVLLFAIIPLFAIFLSVKAKPFINCAAKEVLLTDE